jgi:hypothetical protein
VTTPPDLPPCDPGNELLAAGASRLTGSLADTADGQRFMLTIRTPSTTLSVFLTREEARGWGEGIIKLAATMNGLAVAPGLARRKRPS